MNLFILVCLANKLSLSPSLCSIIKNVKFKHNNVLMSMKFDLAIFNITFIYLCIFVSNYPFIGRL